MTLQTYLSDTGITQAQFAKQVGLTQPAISKYLRGKLVPSMSAAIKISHATGGKVPVTAWVPPEPAENVQEAAK